MRTQIPQNTSARLSQEELNELCSVAMERFDELIEVLGVDLRREKTKYVGVCPIHPGADSDTAFNIFHDGNSIVGNWKCRTHQCEREFTPTLIGFVRGVLSSRDGWEDKTCDKYSFGKTVRFLLDFVGDRYNKNIVPDRDAIERKIDARLMSALKMERSGVTKIKRNILVDRLNIPSSYHINRGFSREILEKYDVGTCLTKGREMFCRSVVPIYDDNHEFIVGCSGRSIFEKCPKCKAYHDSRNNCPPPEKRKFYCKWRNNDGFKCEEWLYNYWFAKEHIYKHKCAVLVESPGNVWRLEEAGIKTSLGIFGTSLTPFQMDLLNKCGAMNIMLCMDKGEAGETATEVLLEKLGKLYNVDVLDIDGDDDIGEISAVNIKRDIAPIIYGAYLE